MVYDQFQESQWKWYMICVILSSWEPTESRVFVFGHPKIWPNLCTSSMMWQTGPAAQTFWCSQSAGRLWSGFAFSLEKWNHLRTLRRTSLRTWYDLNNIERSLISHLLFVNPPWFVNYSIVYPLGLNGLNVALPLLGDMNEANLAQGVSRVSGNLEKDLRYWDDFRRPSHLLGCPF